MPDVKILKSLLFDICKLSQLFPNDICIQSITTDLSIKYDILLNNTKSNYYTKLIMNSKSASKGMWSVVNLERGKNNAPKIKFADIVLKADGTKFGSPKDAIDAMNERFLNAAAACGAPAADTAGVRRALSAARAPADRSLRLRPFMAAEVFRTVTTHIPPKPSKDVYGISMEIIRMAIIPLAPVWHLSSILALKKDHIRDPLKLARYRQFLRVKGKKITSTGIGRCRLFLRLLKYSRTG